MALEAERAAAAGGLPQPHRLVIRAAGQQRARPATTPRSLTQPVWPSRRWRRGRWRLPQPHRLVLDPLASWRPSGDHATPFTRAGVALEAVAVGGRCRPPTAAPSVIRPAGQLPVRRLRHTLDPAVWPWRRGARGRSAPTAAPSCHRARWPRWPVRRTPRSVTRRLCPEAVALAAAGGLPQPHRLVISPLATLARPATTPHSVTPPVCPSRQWRSRPAGRLPQPHRVVNRSAGEARPVGRHATLGPSVCPSRQGRSRPLAASHSRTVSSSDPLASARPVRRPRELRL